MLTNGSGVAAIPILGRRHRPIPRFPAWPQAVLMLLSTIAFAATDPAGPKWTELAIGHPRGRPPSVPLPLGDW
jgi:hypothetical protein